MSSLTGARITLIDFAKPLAARKRTHTGPYFFNVPDPGPSNGATFFYMSPKALRMDRHGAPLRLRLEEAPQTSRGVTGYYADEYGDSVITPIIARLPRGRGFLAGATMGNGMASWLDDGLIESESDAHMRAHSFAERMAENQREYEAEEAARLNEESA